MTYQPGDAFDVYWPNRVSEVEDMLHRLGLQNQRNHRVLISLLKDTKKRGKEVVHMRQVYCRKCLLIHCLVVGAQVPSYIPQNASLLYLLTWCLEIRSVPKKVCESVGILHNDSINTNSSIAALTVTSLPY